MLLSTDKCSYNEQVIPHSNSITTFCVLPFYTSAINQTTIKVRITIIMYSFIYHSSEICALTNVPVFQSQGPEYKE